MKNKFVLIFFLVIVLVNCLFSQSKEELFKQREKILKELTLSSKLLEETIKKRGASVQSVKLINKKISYRNDLIASYRSEIVILNTKIEERELTIDKLETDLAEQKILYANIVKYTYKNYNYYTKAVYLLASESLNQFYLRNKYLQQLKAARKEKVELIEKVELQISKELVLLREDKIKITEALESVRNENSILIGEKKQKQNFITQLSNEEKQLKKLIEDKKKIEEKIKKEIEKIIEAEAKKNKYAKLTPEEQLVSDDFFKNKGKLPWPTTQGVITEFFGEHYHPVLRNVKVRNNGIDISTPSNAVVRCIFKGEVSKVFSIKGSNSTVIIRHGSYYTVYHNIINVKVNVGDEIDTKTVLGSAGLADNNESSMVHLEVWKGLEKLDPQKWISD